MKSKADSEREKRKKESWAGLEAVTSKDFQDLRKGENRTTL